MPTPWQAGPQQHSSELGADGSGDQGRKETGQARGPSCEHPKPGSHLKCQQQEERFDAVETAIHKVPHEEVVGLRDVTTHLVAGGRGVRGRKILVGPKMSHTTVASLPIKRQPPSDGPPS